MDKSLRQAESDVPPETPNCLCLMLSEREKQPWLDNSQTARILEISFNI